MLARLEMKLDKKDNELSGHMASLFHGVLMENLSREYADELHISKLHAYTQHLEKRAGVWYWIVTALNEDTVDRMIKKSLIQLSEFTIKNKQLQVHILEKKYEEMSDKELAGIFYNGQRNRYITIRFITPTAFKQNGKYINYPDIRLIFLSIMNKYDASNCDEQIYDEETLKQLMDNTALSRYELRSSIFNMEGIRIPAFTGRITLKVTGPQTMSDFANMLFCFGSYSGIGIKTSLGMGAINILEEGERKNAR